MKNISRRYTCEKCKTILNANDDISHEHEKCPVCNNGELIQMINRQFGITQQQTIEEVNDLIETIDNNPKAFTYELATELEEFSEKGFDRASTNSIAERAGVSKGLVFHYFGSKQRLYRELVEQCVADVEAFVLSETPEGMGFAGMMIRLS